MYQLLSLLSGVLISVMVAFNGDLTRCFGDLYSSVIIHAVGLFFAFLLCLWQKAKIARKVSVPFWAYLGGAVGVLTILFNNYSFSRISMTTIVALGLLGQAITSAIIDGFGLFGMAKCPIRRSTWIGLLLSSVGIVVMLDSTIADGIFAVIFSLGAGFTVVMSRTMNSRLSDKIGAFAGSFYNYLVALPICILIAALIPVRQSVTLEGITPWMFSGGMLGVVIVYICNVCVPKVPAVRLTMLSFLGQIFSGIAIDIICGNSISGRLFWGGIISSIGLFAGMLIDVLDERRKADSTI